MAQADPFGRWLDQFADLADVDVFDLPDWQQPLAFIHQFALSAVGDGAGSLFYSHTENIENTAEAFAAIDEPELAEKILTVRDALAALIEEAPPNLPDLLLEQCVNGAATKDVVELDALLSPRWSAIYAKLEARAKANGWRA